MPIRFKCPHCKKGLVVKDALAGKKAACPACKKALKIPAPVSLPANVEELAAAAFSDEPPKAAAKPEAEKPAAPQFIEFPCPFCDAALKLSADMAGKRAPCPECKQILKVPNLKVEKPKDWREAATKGPSLAAANQPQKLEGAWGTATDKGKVSQDALEEADAILEEEVPEFGGGWPRRGLWAAAILSVLFISWWGLTRWRTGIQQKNAIDQALEITDPKKAKEANLPAAWAAVIHRGAGEYYTVKKEPAKARDQFLKAQSPYTNQKDKVDKDLFLTRLVLSWVDLGGSPAEAISKERVEWPDLIKNLGGLLDNIDAEEAKTMAVRDLSFRLNQRKQGHIATTLASGSKSQRIALQPEKKDDSKEKKDLAPDPKKEIKDLNLRMGYAEGLARKGQIPEAKDYVQAPTKNPLHILQACLGVAAVLQEDAKKIGNETEEFVGMAVEIARDQKQKIKPSPLTFFLLIKVMAAKDPEKARDLFNTLPKDAMPKEFRPWAQLAILEAELAKAAAEVPISKAEEVEDETSLPRALAWEAIARRNSKLGFQNAMRTAADEMTDRRVRALIYLGVALGVQDRTR